MNPDHLNPQIPSQTKSTNAINVSSSSPKRQLLQSNSAPVIAIKSPSMPKMQINAPPTPPPGTIVHNSVNVNKLILAGGSSGTKQYNTKIQKMIPKSKPSRSVYQPVNPIVQKERNELSDLFHRGLVFKELFLPRLRGTTVPKKDT